MSKGMLLYAMNTPKTDYGKIANVAALLINHHVGLPVSVVVDKLSTVDPGLFDQVIVHAPKRSHLDLLEDRGSSWRNKERHNYLALTPYDQTLVLDSDYLLFNNHLINLFDTVEPLYLSYDAIKTNGDEVEPTEQYISEFSLPLVWGTCFYFRKSPEATLFFDLVEYVRANYGYFTQRYDLSTHMYRNDFTFAIAAHLYSDYRPLVIARNPYPITTAYSHSRIINVSQDGLTLIGPGESNGISYLPNTNVHVLNKQTILDHYELFKQYFL